jgi:hypothetical protein
MVWSVKSISGGGRFWLTARMAFSIFWVFSRAAEAEGSAIMIYRERKVVNYWIMSFWCFPRRSGWLSTATAMEQRHGRGWIFGTMRSRRGVASGAQLDTTETTGGEGVVSTVSRWRSASSLIRRGCAGEDGRMVLRSKEQGGNPLKDVFLAIRGTARTFGWVAVVVREQLTRGSNWTGKGGVYNSQSVACGGKGNRV